MLSVSSLARGSGLAPNGFDPLPACLGAYVLLLGLPLHPAIGQAVLAVAVVLSVSRPASAMRINWLLWGSVAAFLACTAVSTILSEDTGHSLDVSTSLLAGLFLMIVVSRLQRAMQVYLLLFAFSLACLLIALFFIATALVNWNSPVEAWMILTGFPQFGVPNDLGILALGGTIVMAFLSERAQLDKILQLFLVLTLIAVFACLIIYRSRGGILALLLMALLLISGQRRPLWLAYLAGAVLLGIVIDGLTGFSFLQKLVQIQTVSTRIPLWIAAQNMFLDAPIVGHGPGSFFLLYREYVDFDALPDWVVIDGRDMPWPHNLYLELLAERGMLGLLCFGVVTLTGLRLLNQCSRTYEESGFRPVIIGLATVLLGLLVLGLIESSFLRHWVIVTFFLIIGLISAMWNLSSIGNQA